MVMNLPVTGAINKKDSPLLISRSKYIRADANHRRPLGDGSLVVMAHAHGKMLAPLMTAGEEGVPGCTEAMKSGALCANIVGGRRYRHQTGEHEARQQGNGLSQFSERIDADPGLARLIADIYLQQDVQRGQGSGALLVQTPGDLETVDTVHPVEALGDGAGFVGLDGANEMPVDVEIRQRFLLGQRLLQVVLTERFLSCIPGFADLFRPVSFADGNEADVAFWTPVFLFKLRDAQANFFQIFWYGRGHIFLLKPTIRRLSESPD